MNWIALGLVVKDTQIRHRWAQHMAQNHPEVDTRDPRQRYRDALIQLQAAVSVELDGITDPPAPPEKVAGYVAEGWRSGV